MKRGSQNISMRNRPTLPEIPEIPEIPPRHRAKIQALIQRRCANYDKKNCLLLDDWMPCVCPQFSARVLNCKYFRSIVLPDDPELYGSLMIIVPKRFCVLCGKPLYNAGNAAKYCQACAKKERRRREAERMRKRRSNLRK